MLFKKEFDIDKEFFTEKNKSPKKIKTAFKVFIVVLILTFGFLVYGAFISNINFKFKGFGSIIQKSDLKEAQEHYLDAIKYYEEGDFAHAIESLNKQIALVEELDAYNCLGKIYQEEGNQALAIENYQHALDINPSFFEPNFELGKIYFSLNDYQNASKYLTQASRVQSDNNELLSLIADSYKRSGHADDAIKIFEKIIENSPDSAFAYAKIGEIYFQRLQYENAQYYFKNSLNIIFEAQTAVMLAKCYFELNRYDEALDVINTVLAENKDNKQALSIKKAIEYKKASSKNDAAARTVEAKKNEPPIDKEIVTKYIEKIEPSIKSNWTPPSGTNMKKASVKFTINSKGELVSNEIYSSSGNVEFDKAALGAITLSAPFPPLPENLYREFLDIIFTFDFNIK